MPITAGAHRQKIGIFHAIFIKLLEKKCVRPRKLPKYTPLSHWDFYTDLNYRMIVTTFCGMVFLLSMKCCVFLSQSSWISVQLQQLLENLSTNEFHSCDSCCCTTTLPTHRSVLLSDFHAKQWFHSNEVGIRASIKYSGPSSSLFLILCGDVELNPGPYFDSNQLENMWWYICDTIERVNTNERHLHNVLQEQHRASEREKTLTSETAYLTDEVDRLEKIIRKDNLRFYGIEESENETQEESAQKVIDLINETCNPNVPFSTVDIRHAHRIKAGTKRNEPRPVIVTFAQWKDKMALLKLRNAREGPRKAGLRVSNDLTRRQSSQLAEIRRQGKTGYFFKGKLIVNESHRYQRNYKRPHEKRKPANNSGSQRDFYNDFYNDSHSNHPNIHDDRQEQGLHSVTHHNMFRYGDNHHRLYNRDESPGAQQDGEHWHRLRTPEQRHYLAMPVRTGQCPDDPYEVISSTEELLDADPADTTLNDKTVLNEYEKSPQAPTSPNPLMITLDETGKTDQLLDMDRSYNKQTSGEAINNACESPKNSLSCQQEVQVEIHRCSVSPSPTPTVLETKGGKQTILAAVPDNVITTERTIVVDTARQSLPVSFEKDQSTLYSQKNTSVNLNGRNAEGQIPPSPVLQHSTSHQNEQPANSPHEHTIPGRCAAEETETMGTSSQPGLRLPATKSSPEASPPPNPGVSGSIQIAPGERLYSEAAATASPLPEATCRGTSSPVEVSKGSQDSRRSSSVPSRLTRQSSSDQSRKCPVTIQTWLTKKPRITRAPKAQVKNTRSTTRKEAANKLGK